MANVSHYLGTNTRRYGKPHLNYNKFPLPDAHCKLKKTMGAYYLIILGVWLMVITQMSLATSFLTPQSLLNSS